MPSLAYIEVIDLRAKDGQEYRTEIGMLRKELTMRKVFDAIKRDGLEVPCRQASFRFDMRLCDRSGSVGRADPLVESLHIAADGYREVIGYPPEPVESLQGWRHGTDWQSLVVPEEHYLRAVYVDERVGHFIHFRRKDLPTVEAARNEFSRLRDQHAIEEREFKPHGFLIDLCDSSGWQETIVVSKRSMEEILGEALDITELKAQGEREQGKPPSPIQALKAFCQSLFL